MMCIGRGAAAAEASPVRCAVGGACRSASVDERVEEIGEPLPKVLIVGTYDVGELRRTAAPGQQHSGWLSLSTCGSE
jgi:hypothetical protein